MSELYIGLMSGTSMDGIDAAIVDFAGSAPELIASKHQSIPTELHAELTALCTPGENEIQRVGKADVLLGRLFAKVCLQLLEENHLSNKEIRAIGSHGQTIRHHPFGDFPFTLQIGDPNVIAEQTGITTIADFRRKDIAAGGQGAPLTPAFHQYAFQSDDINRVIVNIGGIANITLLDKDLQAPIIGFDTGPGNTLMDAWAQRHLNKPYDANGAWATQGLCDEALLEQLLSDAYFELAAPKSTGREYFHLTWLDDHMRTIGCSASAVDIQQTLLQLTAVSIMQAIQAAQPEPAQVIICGGGVHNTALLQALTTRQGNHKVLPSSELGIDPDWIEAIAFAWMAKQTLNAAPSNIPAVTGARQSLVLGGMYL